MGPYSSSPIAAKIVTSDGKRLSTRVMKTFLEWTVATDCHKSAVRITFPYYIAQDAPSGITPQYHFHHDRNSPTTCNAELLNNDAHESPHSPFDLFTRAQKLALIAVATSM